MRTEHVADWMSTPPIVVTLSTSLAAAQRIMEQRHVRRLPVVQDGRLVGIITWGDVRAAQPSTATTLSVYEWRALLDQVTVAECMTTSPVTIAPDAVVLEAARQMLTHKVSGLPVLEDGRVVGVITESDLFRLLLAQETSATHADSRRATAICHHCGARLRRRSFEAIDPYDECWRCHYHLHRCDNCRYFDGLACLLDRDERRAPIPGQRCPAFIYLLEGPTVAEDADSGRPT
jgi:CBS domain-containing protein